jgi:Cft2 family RNA processing exonuclease
LGSLLQYGPNDRQIKLHTPTFNLVDFGEIDVILISNFYNISALPYITELTAFKGKIYATEPTIQIGK